MNIADRNHLLMRRVERRCATIGGLRRAQEARLVSANAAASREEAEEHLRNWARLQEQVCDLRSQNTRDCAVVDPDGPDARAVRLSL